MRSRRQLHGRNKNDKIKKMEIKLEKRRKLIRKLLVSGALAAALFALTGCGEQVADMTESEEAQIVTYAAHIVSKYNKKQPDGIVYVYIPETESTSSPLSQEPSQQEPDAGELPEGYYDPAEFEDVPTTTGTNMDAIEPEGAAVSSDATPMELSDVIGIPGLDMQWTGTTTADDYVDPSGATLATPNKGNRYVILTVTIRNTTDDTIRCNIAELVPAIALIVNGSERIDASQMLVSTDFATFNADIGPGESVDTNIFFQRKASEIADSDAYGLEVTLNGVTGSISQR